jgi:lipase chaperone LimK
MTGQRAETSTAARRARLAAAALAVAAALAWWAHARAPGGAADTSPPAASGLSTWLHAGMGHAATPAPPPPAFHTGLENLPASLRGTEVPGKLAVDAAGHLKVDRGVRDMFDYFLTTTGEEGDEVIRARVQAYAKDHLPSAATAELMALYDQYLSYKQRCAGLAQNMAGNGLEQIRSRVAAVRLAQAEMFNPDVVQAFFGDDNAYDDYEIGKAAILQDRSLSATDKARQLAALRANLPAGLGESISAAETVETLDEVTAQWKQHGGTPAELRNIREQLVGADAADRLETLDAQNAKWNARVNAYLAQRDQILHDPSLSDIMRQQQIEALRQQGFSGAEQVRVGALERIHDAGLSVGP